MATDEARTKDVDGGRVDVTVNGKPVTLEYEPGETLMRTLRRAGYTEIKNGCSEGVCGSCNVFYGDNQIVRSCLVPTEQYDGEDLVTAKGIVRDNGTLHPVQQEFLDFGAAQCGFCIPGIILSAVQLLEDNTDPSEAEIRQTLRGNICRCTGYMQQIEAIQSAADRMDDRDAESSTAEGD